MSRIPDAYNRVILMGTVEWTTREGFGMVLRPVPLDQPVTRVAVEFKNGSYGDSEVPHIPEGAAVLVDGRLSGRVARDEPVVIAEVVRTIESGNHITHEKKRRT